MDDGRCLLDAQVDVGGSIGLDLDRTGVGACERFVALGFHLERVAARGDAFEVEDAVVERVHLVGGHLLTVLHEAHGGSVDRHPLVYRARSVVEQVVDYLVFEVFHCAHHIARRLGRQTEIVAHTAGYTHTFLAAVVLVEGAMARGLVGVIESFEQKSRYTVLEHTEVAVVGDAGVAVGDGIVAVIEVEVAANVHVGAAVGALRVELVHVVGAPDGLAHGAASLCEVAAVTIIAAVEDQGIVGRRGFGGGVGVYGDEHVHVVGLNLCGYLGEGAIVFCLVGRALDIGIGPVLAARVHDVLSLDAHLLEGLSELEYLPEIGVALIESARVGASRRGEVGVGNGGHGAIVRAPASVARVEVDAHVRAVLGGDAGAYEQGCNSEE